MRRAKRLLLIGAAALQSGCIYAPYPYAYRYPGYAYAPAYIGPPAVVYGGYGYRGYRY